MVSVLKKWAAHADDIKYYGLLFGGLGLVIYLWQRYYYDLQILAVSEVRRQELAAAISTTFQDFMTLTFSLIVEALPFVVLGVTISVLIQVFLPTRVVMKWMPKNGLARRIIVSFLGILMPVCECGNVPVARGLMARGFTTQEAIVFLLAAPSVNIITFIVTYQAFNQQPSMAIARVLVTLIIANVVALFVAKAIAAKKILTPDFVAQCEVSQHAPRSMARAVELFHSEMWLIVRLLVVGALIAAASQTFIPREVIVAIGSDVVLSVLAMMALAFVISICSSVDAFFALAYVGVFGPGPILAFLVAGPMVDIKMIALMKSTFRARTIAVIVAGVLLLTFITGVIFSYVW